jgi:hypothetical protein
MTLAVKQDSGVRVVVHSVVTGNERLLVLEQSEIFFRIWFLFDQLDKRRLCTSDTNK